MMCAYARFHLNRSFHLREPGETELDALDKHKFGYVQQSLKIRSKSENDTDIAEMIL